MGEDWSKSEIDIIIADYFSMLFDEIAGKPINKTKHRKQILPLLNGRSDGSIEFKHCNISAVLIKLGQPYIKGYQPRYNFQRILLDRVQEFLDNKEKIILPQFESFANQTIDAIPLPKFDKWIEDKPLISTFEEPSEIYFKANKTNFLEKEQRNRSIGDSGEELIIKYEKWRLNNEGKSNLADKIEWVSKEKGDGLGYDILSKNKNGTDRYIEVKSTRLRKETPIFFSKTEYEFSKIKTDQYWLYRVFNIQSSPKMFLANGRFDDFCTIEPVSFKGHF